MKKDVMKRWTNSFQAFLFVTLGISSAHGFAGQTDREPYVFERTGNPFITHVRSADPSAEVWEDGQVWIYASHDQPDAKNYESMDGYRAYSSPDLIHWTDHGQILHSSDLSWGDQAGFMFAPDAAFKDGTYYLYFPHKTKTQGWKVGIATSTKPEGPFTDRGYVTGPNMVGGFDPNCFIDDDGQAYLYWGSRFDTEKPLVARLNRDMTTLAEAPRTIEFGRPSDFTDEAGEGTYMHKYNGKYYFSYSAGNGYAAIGDTPYGPFHHLHMINKTGNKAQDHHSIIEFKGQWYYFYHRGDYFDGTFKGNRFRRNVCVDKLFYNEDGTIKLVERSN